MVNALITIIESMMDNAIQETLGSKANAITSQGMLPPEISNASKLNALTKESRIKSMTSKAIVSLIALFLFYREFRL